MEKKEMTTATAEDVARKILEKQIAWCNEHRSSMDAYDVNTAISDITIALESYAVQKVDDAYEKAAAVAESWPITPDNKEFADTIRKLKSGGSE